MLASMRESIWRREEVHGDAPEWLWRALRSFESYLIQPDQEAPPPFEADHSEASEEPEAAVGEVDLAVVEIDLAVEAAGVVVAVEALDVAIEEVVDVEMIERVEEDGAAAGNPRERIAMDMTMHDRAHCYTLATGPGAGWETMSMFDLRLDMLWFRPDVMVRIFRGMGFGEHGQHFWSAVRQHGGPAAALKAGAFGNSSMREHHSYAKLAGVLESVSRGSDSIKSAQCMQHWVDLYGPAKSRCSTTPGWCTALRQVMVSLFKKRGYLTYARCLDEYLRYDKTSADNLVCFADLRLGDLTRHVKSTMETIFQPFANEIKYGQIYFSSECVTTGSVIGDSSAEAWSKVKKKSNLKTVCEDLNIEFSARALGIHIEGWGTTMEHTTASLPALSKRLKKDNVKLLPGETPRFYAPYASKKGMALSASIYEVVSSRLAELCHFGPGDESAVVFVQSLAKAGSTPMISIRERDLTGDGNRLTAGHAASVWILVTPSQLMHADTREPLVPRGARNN